MDQSEARRVERYADTKRAEHADEERRKEEQAREEAAEIERRRQEKADRDDVRRAKASTIAWQRKIDKTAAVRDALSTAKGMLVARIAQIERRGWLARSTVPHESVLSRSRGALVELDEKIREADASTAPLRSVPRPRT